MFKRIAKISGIVLLLFALLVGAVVGVMFLRGDFEKDVIKPTSIAFSINQTNLVFDAVENADDVYSFTITAEPYNVTETECTITVTDPNLITFKTRVGGEWVNYNSGRFFINQPVYFSINKFDDENADLYTDGTVGIIVKDSSGLLKATLNLEIDRNVTSISIKDWAYGGDNVNNAISNGLFGYELTGNTIQKLEAVTGESYPLEIITAPLKALDAIASKGTKITEMYYVVDGNPKLITHEGSVVKIKTYNNEGELIDDPNHTPCEFLEYDTLNNVYVLKSNQAGLYKFKLATYPTYAIQDMLAFDESITFIDRLNRTDENGKLLMTVKDVEVLVSGTSADVITFDQEGTTTTINLFKDNYFVANNGNYEIDGQKVHNLGISLQKSGGTAVESRYGQLEFLDINNASHYDDELNFTFKEFVLNENKLQQTENDVVIKLNSGNMKAKVSGFANDAWNTIDEQTYDATLKCISGVYSLTLTKEDGDAITFELHKGADADKILDFSTKAVKISGEDWQSGDEKFADVVKIDSVESCYLAPTTIDCFVIGDEILANGTETTYKFKTLAKDKIYLSILDGDNKLVNDKFIVTITPNGASTLLNIMPIEALGTVNMYAIVVNDDGSWSYTKNDPPVSMPYNININMTEMTMMAEQDNFSFNITIRADGSYAYSTMDVDDLIEITNSGSYGMEQVVFFATKYSKLNFESKPSDWGYFDVYTYDASAGYVLANVTPSTAWDNTIDYYVKNNFCMTDEKVAIDDGAGNIYYLLGTYDEVNGFKNVVEANGYNHYSQIYPAIINTGYDRGTQQPQSAIAYINQFIAGLKTTSKALVGTESCNVSYNTNLAEGSRITTDFMHETYKIGATENATAHFMLLRELFANSSEWASHKGKITYYKCEDNELTIYEDGDLENELESSWELTTAMNNGILIDSWEIKSVAITSDAVTLEVYPVSGDAVFTHKIETITISRQDYDKSLKNVGLMRGISLKSDLGITVMSEYQFDGFDDGVSNSFGGTYFDEQSEDGNGYQIIAGHSAVDMDWNGNTGAAVEKISDKTAQIILDINHKDSEQILKAIFNGLGVKAEEYDKNDAKVADISSADLKFDAITLGYLQANESYDSDRIYYTREDGGGEPVYTKATIDESEWTSDPRDPKYYKNYYYLVVVTEFEVHCELESDHYIKLSYTYGTDAQGNPKTLATTETKLYTLSREVTGYQLYVADTVYDAAGSRYIYENNEYVLESDKNQKLNIELVIEVEWDDDAKGFVYKAVPIKGDGDESYTESDYLYYDIAKTNRIESDWSAAFTTSDGGWIKVLPFYAENKDFKLSGDDDYDDHIVFDDSNKLVMAMENRVDATTIASIGDIVIKHQNNENVYKNIKTFVSANNIEFTLNVSDNEIRNKDVTLGVKYYYDDDPDIPFNDQLDIRIETTDLIIKRDGQEIQNNYIVSYDKSSKPYKAYVKLPTEDNANALISVEYKDDEWHVIRKTWDEINITIEFITVKGKFEKTLKFVEPYKITPSTTNYTSTIYSGTKFVLATVGDEHYVEYEEYDADDPGKYESGSYYILDVDQYIQAEYADGVLKKNGVALDDGTMLYKKEAIGKDRLYKLESRTAGDEFNIYYRVKSQGWNTSNKVGLVNSKFIFEVPNVEVLTEYEFMIKFKQATATSEDEIKTFPLTVAPNMIAMGKPSKQDLIMDDYQDNTYSLDGLKYASYSTASTDNPYYWYEDPTLINDLTGIEYKVSYYKPISTFVLGNSYYYSNESNGYVEVKDQQEFDSLKFAGHDVFTTEDEVILSQDGYAYKVVTEYADSFTYEYNLIDKEYKLLTAQPTDGSTMYARVDKPILRYDGYTEISEYVEGNTYWLNTTTGLYELKDKDFYEANTGEVFKSRINQLKVYPIENIGTHKVRVEIYNKTVVDSKELNEYVGVHSFEITSLYELEVADIEITAKEPSVLDWDQVKSLFKLKRNGEFVESDEAELINVEIKSKQAGKLNVNTVESTSLSIEYADGYGLLNPETQEIILMPNGYVDCVEYNLVLTFRIDGVDYNFTMGQTYVINVLPHIVDARTEVLLAETDYQLVKGTNPLFAETTEVYSFEFTDLGGEGKPYTITSASDGYKIRFNASANVYNTSVPVRLTYTNEGYNNITLDYNHTFTIVNPTQVNTNYPFNVESVDVDTFGTFNTTLSQITNAVGDGVDVNDILIDIARYNSTDYDDIYEQCNPVFDGRAYYYKNNVGEYVKTTIAVENAKQYYTLKENWNSNVYLAYDIALNNPGNVTTINLNNDTLLNINRYSTEKYTLAKSYDPGKEYYKYDTDKNEFVKETAVDDDEISKYKYYTLKPADDYTDCEISKVELVAVSSEYSTIKTLLRNAINLQTPNQIMFDDSIPYTGYMVFKIHSEAGSYGYYVLKFVKSDNFSSVIYSESSRRNREISGYVNGSDRKIYEYITGKESLVEASHIDESLIEDDSSNVYLFMVKNNNNAKLGGNPYDKGEQIPKDATLPQDMTTHHIEVAVVVSSGVALVHICNYTLTLTPDVEVSTEGTPYIAETLNPDYYHYQSKPLSYRYGATNTYALASFFKVTNKANTPKGLESISISNEFKASDELTIDGNVLKVNGSDVDFIEVDTSAKTFTINKPLGLNKQVYFWLTLEYTGGFKVKLKVVIDPIQFTSMTTDTVNQIGESSAFNTTYDLIKIIGNYNGSYAIKYWLATESEPTDWIVYTSRTGYKTFKVDDRVSGWNYGDHKLTFKSGVKVEDVKLKIRLLDAAPVKDSNPVLLRINPQIFVAENAEGFGAEDKRAVTETTPALENYGSYLNVDVADHGTLDGVKVVTIYGSDESKYYLQFMVKDFSKIQFNVQDANGPVKYLIDDSGSADTIEFDETDILKLKFAHTLNATNLSLIIKVYNSSDASGDSFEINGNNDKLIYITLPKTYDLVATYRMEGATYESIVNGETLDFDFASDGSISDKFFGSEDDNITVKDGEQSIRIVQDPNGEYVMIDGQFVKYDASNTAHNQLTRYNKIADYKVSDKLQYSRIAVKLVDKDYYYGYSSLSAVGLFMTDNPNMITKIETVAKAEINDEYTFECASDKNMQPTIIKLNNGNGEIKLVNLSGNIIEGYVFNVYYNESDAHHTVTFNDDLLLSGSVIAGRKTVDSIMLTNKEIQAAGDDGIELAYLNYAPVVGGQAVNKAEVVITNSAGDKLDIHKIAETTKQGYASAIIISDDDDATDCDELTLYILTVNGVSEQVTIYVSNLEVTKGYKDGENYEAIFAGTEGNSMEGTAESTQKTRLTVSLGYTYIYVGAVDGQITNMPIGMEVNYKVTDKTMIVWDETDETNKEFATRDIDSEYKYVTMVFDVTIDGSDTVINKIFYTLYLLQGWEIGISGLDLTKESAINLYLGNNHVTEVTDKATYKYQPERYYGENGELLHASTAPAVYYFKANDIDIDNDGNYRYTVIDVTKGKESQNTLYVTLNRKYHTEKGEIKSAPITLTPSNFSDYLSLKPSDKTDELKGNVIIVDESETSKIKIEGNPSGKFALNVVTTAGYVSEPVEVTVYRYDSTSVTSKLLNSDGAHGYESGATIDLINTDPGSEKKNSYAFNVYQRDAKVEKDATTNNERIVEELKPIFTSSGFDEGVTLQYQLGKFPITTSINDINKESMWGDSNPTLGYTIGKPDEIDCSEGYEFSITLPEVELSVSEDAIKSCIVSVRLIVTYNNGTPMSYFSHYKVYNPSFITVNEAYSKNKTITYAENDNGRAAWKSGSEIVLMGEGGLYDISEKITVQPSDWNTTYYTYLKEDGTNYTAEYDADSTYYEPVTSGKNTSSNWYKYDSTDQTMKHEDDMNATATSDNPYYIQKTYSVTDWKANGHKYYMFNSKDNLFGPVAAPAFDADKTYKYNTIAQYFVDKANGLIEVEEPDGWNAGNKYFTFDSTTGVYTDVNNGGYDNQTTYYTATIGNSISSEPEDWDKGGYYSYDTANKKYMPVAEETAFAPDTYYKIEFKPVSKYRFKTLINGQERYIMEVHYDSTQKAIVGILPHNTTDAKGVLFSNSATMEIKIYKPDTPESEDNGMELYTDTWTIKANKTIEAANEPVLLNKLFLQSEIGPTLYNTGSIIGVYNELSSNTDMLKNFVWFSDKSEFKGTVSIGLKQGESIHDGFEIYNVTFTSTSPNVVFNISETYLVLQSENACAMGFDYNGGTYYMNLTIDDSSLISGTNKAQINLYDKMTIYYVDGTVFTSKKATEFTSATLSIAKVDNNDDSYEIKTESGKIILNDIDEFTFNKSIQVEVSLGAVKRKIELYFDIVIKPEKLVENKDYMPYNSIIAEAVNATEDGSLSIDYINANENLKKELLSVIKFKDKDVDVSSMTALARWEISVVTDDLKYVIKYQYSHAGNTYVRTLKMLGCQITSASTTLKDNQVEYLAELANKFTSENSLKLETDVINADTSLKSGLLDLIKFKEAVKTPSDKWTISAVLNMSKLCYEITYNYKDADAKEDYTRVFVMSLQALT